MLKKEFSEIKRILEGHPKKERLIDFLHKFYSNFSAEFIILFGSSARGNFNYRSDIDLLIISNSIQGDYFKRLRKMYEISKGGIDFFVYTTKEFKKMVKQFNITALEALSEGIFLLDKGLGKKCKGHIDQLIKENKLQKSDHAWIINVERS